MKCHIGILAVFCVAATAFPVWQDTASQEEPWNIQEQGANLAINKADITKELNSGVWKSRVVSSDLYSQDSHNPMAAELKLKLKQESERLRARLRKELMELGRRLSPYPSHAPHAPANVRHILGPFTQGLHTALDSNTRDLCGRLGRSLRGPDGPSLSQEALEEVGRALDESNRRRTAAFEDFKTKAFEAIEEDQDGGRKELWEEVTASLGQEICSFSLEEQGKVAALKVSLAGLLTTAEPADAEAASRVDLFCQNSSAQNQKFIANLEQQTARLDQQQREGDSTRHVNIESIQEDFSSRLNALLQDIVHTLD
ncbi:uncharacterized protein LOC143478130 [Brachyhypopomus gauderio]|uniref:uncharacterized protein LOC143478130 n=1 Tax=Brachyhypopomus gauderio TaxID=698409 RepID=UPI0040436516